MSNFVMLVGLPASGKSSLANKLLGYKVFSSDEYREKLLGDVNFQNNNDTVFSTMHKDIKGYMKTGQDIVYDACNISAKRRKAFLESIRGYGYHLVCTLMATPYEECLRRNAERDRKVPEEAIKNIYMNFYVPYYNEGWDDIQVIYCNENTYKDMTFKNFFSHDMSQDNPNHTLSLLEHNRKCAKLALLTSFGKNPFINNIRLYEAGLLHDNGKIFTKDFHNAKGEPTQKAHYYNHENVGAYNSLFYLKEEWQKFEDVLYIANLIQYHMQPYFIETERAKKKFINLVGEDMYKDIMILHKADKEAH